MIDDVVLLEELYLAHHSLRSAYPMLLRAREKFPDNHKIAAAVHALFICLRATDQALDNEWETKEVLETLNESRDAMQMVRIAVNSRKAKA